MCYTPGHRLAGVSSGAVQIKSEYIKQRTWMHLAHLGPVLEHECWVFAAFARICPFLALGRALLGCGAATVGASLSKTQPECIWHPGNHNSRNISKFTSKTFTNPAIKFFTKRQLACRQHFEYTHQLQPRLHSSHSDLLRMCAANTKCLPPTRMLA